MSYLGQVTKITSLFIHYRLCDRGVNVKVFRAYRDSHAMEGTYLILLHLHVD
jgi:hypothetical protein